MRMWSFRRDACSRRQPLPAGPQLTDPPPADSVLLQGSWDLARKVINKVTLHIIPYNPNEGAYKLLQFRRVSHAEPRVAEDL